MNNRAILITAVILAFIAGFMSAEMVVVRGGFTGEHYTVIEANNTKIIPINDRQYYPIVMKTIESANRSIDMVMYEIKWYGNPEGDSHDVSKLAVALVDAKDRGVSVRIIMDDGRGYGFENDDMITWAENWRDYFESHGIEVKFDWSNETTHDKLLIVDGKVVIVGSTNWSTSALDYNHEANAYIESQEVAEEYEKYFNSLWEIYS